MSDALVPANDRRGYQIYTLSDPRDNLIYYVGISVNAHKRFKYHRRGSNASKDERSWIAELKGMGMSPILHVIEIIEPGENSYAIACERELYWINETLRLGHPLLNQLGVTRSYFPPTIRKKWVSKPDQKTRDYLKPEYKQSPSHDDDFMTSEEACKRLSVSPRTLERYLRDGLLKKYRRRIGREVFYKRSEVEDLLRIRPAEDTEDQ